MDNSSIALLLGVCIPIVLFIFLNRTVPKHMVPVSIKDTLLNYDTEPVNLLISIAAVLWGLWIATPWGTTNTLFMTFSESEVGIFMVVLGLVNLITLLRGFGFLNHAVLSCLIFCWCYLAVSAFLIRWTGVAFIIYTIMCAASVWVWLRISSDQSAIEV